MYQKFLRAFEIGAITGSILISKAAFFAIPDVKKFSQTGEGLSVGKLV